MDWYKFTPVDTLFFKGAEPMNLGENHTTSHLFPPPAHTLSGALRTAVLTQNSVAIEDYAAGKAPSNITQAIGEAGQSAPFSVVGPLFMEGDELYVPAPYSCFKEKENTGCNINIFRGKPLRSRLLKSESSHFIWAKAGDSELISIGGMWVKNQDLHSSGRAVSIEKSESFFKDEPRTGIALEKNRRVREGYLYSFNHARLKQSVSLVFGTDCTLPLEKRGVLKLGGEQRFGWYEKLPEIKLQSYENGELFLSLSILEGTSEANEAVVATGKIQYLGGWDLHAGFHKPMKGFFPAGTVCNKKINNNFIAIRG